MPKNTRRVFHDTNVGCDVGFIVLYQGDIVTLPSLVKQSSKFTEPRETPVSLIDVETMVRDYTAHQQGFRSAEEGSIPCEI